MPKEFWPEDTDNKFYLYGEVSIAEIIERVEEKFGTYCDLECIQIDSEYIQTDCIGHDLYDPSDYKNFIVVTKTS